MVDMINIGAPQANMQELIRQLSEQQTSAMELQRAQDAANRPVKSLLGGIAKVLNTRKARELEQQQVQQDNQARQALAKQIAQRTGKPEQAQALGLLSREQLAGMLANQVAPKSSDLTALIKNYQFRESLPPEKQHIFDTVQRANPWLNTGDAFVQANPITREIMGTIGRGIAPERTVQDGRIITMPPVAGSPRYQAPQPSPQPSAQAPLDYGIGQGEDTSPIGVPPAPIDTNLPPELPADPYSNTPEAQQFYDRPAAGSASTQLGGTQIEQLPLTPEQEKALNAPTKGQEEVDKLFAKDVYAPWVTAGGFADTEKQLNQLQMVANALKTNKDLTGPEFAFIPDMLGGVVAPEATDARELVEEVVQRNLRLILGAQFTNEEGKRLIARAYNQSLPAEMNARRLEGLIGQMKQAAIARQEAVNYYEENGTLAGFKGRVPTFSDFEKYVDSLDSAPQTVNDLTQEEREALGL